MNAETFIDWLNKTLEEVVPDNHEEYTKAQLVTRLFDLLYDRMDEAGLIPDDQESK
jgi:hypothetical protein